MELYEQLKQRAAAGNPINVGLVGCGQEGSGMVHVTAKMAGLDTRAIADILPNRPIETLKSSGVPADQICVTNQAGQAEDAIRRGQYVVTEDALILPQLESLHALVEATGVTEVGAQVAWHAIANKKNIVMLNVETDVTVGILLNHLARQAGCVYTVAAGDEPGVCMNLYKFARTLGFEVVCLGKGKNNKIDFHATPATCRAEAESKHMNPKMLAAFKDGTKTMVEMAAISNATGLVVDVPGMHGEKVDLADLSTTLVPEADGGILSRRGCVEYTTGKVAPGVFAIITTDDPRIRADMKFYSMGDGPYYTLYRPYHLCSIETPLSVAESVIYGESTLVPQQMVSEVVAVAKRDLKVGEVIGGIGSADIFNRVYSYQEAQSLKGIPMGLAPGGTVLKDIVVDELLSMENFAPDTNTLVYKLRQLQDAL